MKTFIVTVALALLVACFPSKDEIVTECKTAADEAIIEAWDRCTGYYEETVVPALLILIKTLEDKIAEECNP